MNAATNRMDRGTTRTQNKTLLVLLVALIASAFGPYVVPAAGLRTEHLLIYPLAFLLIMSPRWSVSWPNPLRAIFTVFAAEVAWMVTVTFLRSLGALDAPSMFRVVSHLENIVQPLAIMFLVVAACQKYPQSVGRNLLDKVALAIIVFLTCNTAVAAASMFVDLAGVIDPFYPSSTTTSDSSWHTSLSMDRYTGIFNMPFVSGVSYSLGVLLWAYRVRTSRQLRVRDLLFLGALVLGGLLCVSKVFILGGMFVFMIYLRPLKVIASRPKNAVLVGTAICAVVLAGAPQLDALDDVQTFDRVARYFEVDQNSDNFLATYTANRLVPGRSLVLPLFAEAWHEAPLTGFGLAASTLLDNGYLEAFYQGGFVALIAYLWGLGIILWQGIRLWERRVEEGRLLVAIGVLLVEQIWGLRPRRQTGFLSCFGWS